MKNYESFKEAGAGVAPITLQMNKQTHGKGKREQTPGGRDNEHTRLHLTKRATKKSGCSSDKFTVPWEVFQELDPLERIVIKAQADRGELEIADEPQEVS